MKNLNTFAFVLVLSFFALLNVAAQETSFKDSDLIQLKKTSEDLMKDRKLRIVTVREEFENEGKTTVNFNKSINEILPPDRRHYVYETRTAKGTERVEYIDIGEKNFVRRNGGKWETLVPSNGIGSGMGNGDSDMPKTEITTVRTLTKGAIVNNQTTDLYKTVVNIKFIYPTRTYTNIRIESYWFDNGGRMVKSVTESEYGDTKKSSRTTEDYEYNPNLKIVAPRVKK